MIILLSLDKNRLIEALAPHRNTVTVEAEYGVDVVEGTLLTLAHHGPRASNQAPCLAQNGIAGNPEMIDAIGISHLDLDALGGIMAVMARKPDIESFWELSAYEDLHGRHKLPLFPASEEDLARLYAFKAWSERNRISLASDSANDVSEKVKDAVDIILRIFSEDESLLKVGQAFKFAEDELNSNSFVEEKNGVIIRNSNQSVNYLYITPLGKISRAVVAFNPAQGSITISLADPVTGVSCEETAREVWGPEAGGRSGIAGSPRGKRMGLDDLVVMRDALILALTDK